MSEAAEGGISIPSKKEAAAAGKGAENVENCSNSDGEGSSASSSEQSWRGKPMESVHRGLPPFELEHLGPVSPNNYHRVLYEIPIRESSDQPPRPHTAPGKWDSDHVRLPCAPESKYPRVNDDGTTIIDSRWEMIERALLQPIESSQELQAAILSYNTTYRGQWEFRALHQLLEHDLDESEARVFFEDLLPRIIRLALRLPDLVRAPIPLLKQNHTASLSLSQQQIACLLANAFLCTFPRRNTLKKRSEYSSFPDINFNRLYQSTGTAVTEKLKCIMHYFRRVCPTERDGSNVPSGCVTFVRRSMKQENQVDWAQSAAPVGGIPLHVDASGTIEDEGAGLLQVDFANKFLGGGVLGHGCVQEEIRFVICPELLVGKLFTECLRPTEALIMLGAERYSNYTGYASSFAWSGNFEDVTPRDSSRRRQTAIVAIDALHFVQADHQYREDMMERELNKAYIGFVHWMATPPPGVATGNWGCGAFGGDPYLKTLLQLMVCAQLGRPLAYYTFGNCQLRDDFHEIWQMFRIEGISVQQVWNILTCYQNAKEQLGHKSSKKMLYEFIREELKKGGAGAAGGAGGTEGGGGAGGGPGQGGSGSGSVTTAQQQTNKKSVAGNQKSPDLFASSQSSLDTSNSSQDQVPLLLSEDEEEETNAMMMAASLEASNSEEASTSSAPAKNSSKAAGPVRQLTLLEMLDSHYEQGQATKRPRPSPNSTKASGQGPAKNRKENESDVSEAIEK